MPLATKNHAIILKDGKLAEDCACCGGWYCDSKYGACVVSGVCSSKCEDECNAANGTFSGPSSACCSATQPASLWPSSLTLQLSGNRPQAYGHGCSISGTTRVVVDEGFNDWITDNNGLKRVNPLSTWTAKDVYEGNTFPSTIVLSRGQIIQVDAGYSYAVYTNNGFAGANSIASTEVTCSHVLPNGTVSWKLGTPNPNVQDSVRMYIESSGALQSGYIGSGFFEYAVKSKLALRMGFNTLGTSSDSVSVVQSQILQTTASSVSSPYVAPFACRGNYSDWKLQSVTFQF